MANALFDAASPAMFGARRLLACSGLTWVYYGGWVNKYDGSLSEVANGTLTLTASVTNRVDLGFLTELSALSPATRR